MQIDLFALSPQPTLYANQLIILGNERIEFKLVRSSKRRTIGLTIDGKGLRVLAPTVTSLAQIHQLIEKKSTWILKHLQARHSPGLAAKKPPLPPLAIGSSIPFQGEPIFMAWSPLLDQHPPFLEKETATLFIHRPTSLVQINLNTEQYLQKEICQWWRIVSIETFKARLDHWAHLIGVTYAQLRLTNTRRAWGSASSKGVISLNWKLLQFKLEWIDYVVVHELCHLLEMNHSPTFWAHVAKQIPHHKLLRKAINDAPSSPLFESQPSK